MLFIYRYLSLILTQSEQIQSILKDLHDHVMYQGEDTTQALLTDQSNLVNTIKQTEEEMEEVKRENVSMIITVYYRYN